MERLDDVLIGNQNSPLNNTNIPNGDVNTVLTNMNNSGVGNGGNSGGVNSTNPQNMGNERPALSYTMPGILHFLHHEWNRYELDRQQWEVDKAELMTKISFLQGERRGQENLKNNLIRRIKMLELALKQERIKYHKLKFGVEPNMNDLKYPTSSSTNENNGKNLALHWFTQRLSDSITNKTFFYQIHLEY